MNIKKEYIAPTLELLSYRAEVGFAGSLLISNQQSITLESFTYDNGMERWGWNDNGEGNGLGGNDWTW